MRSVILCLMACVLWATTALAERPRPLGWALDAMRDGDWNAASTIAARDGAVAQDIIEWHRLREGLGTFEEVTAFLERRPDWPGEALLRRRSEPAVIRQSAAEIRQFFSGVPAQTPLGVLAHADALKDNGEGEAANALVIAAWRNMPMNAGSQAAFLADHATLLKKHHVDRLNAMLWQGELTAAARMFDLVPEAHQKLATARISLKRRSGDVDAKIAAVPESLKSHPGLAHDRFEWRVRRGFWDTAKDLLLETSRSAQALGEPQVWSNRRRSLARDEMRDGDPVRAYQMASQHFLESGSNYADLEWLSGYIALHYLEDPELALSHFKNHRDATRSPISRGRAGYWIGRAYEAFGRSEDAQKAYADGAQYQTSFYGLLAAERAGLSFDDSLAGKSPAQDWRTTPIAQRDLFEAGLLLQASGERSLAEWFWTHLAEIVSDEDAALLGQAAIDVGRPHLAVMIGKRVARRGVTIAAPYYALHPLAEADLNMAPEMLLAIARRESEFDPVVQSGAGARGLMQIMPGTGKDVAADLGLSADHTTARLITDPVYNAKLGAEYLAQLAQQFNGNVVMMSAGYNAGPRRPITWMDLFGDPRRASSKLEIVDWIEHIPFRETRNYVMRVTESLPVYRARLGMEPLSIPFSAELVGSTLNAFTPKGE